MWVRRYLPPVDRPSAVVDGGSMVRSLGFLGVGTTAVAWNQYRGPDGNVDEIIGTDQGAA